MSDVQQNPYQAPRSELVGETSRYGGSIENTLAGNADLEIGAVWSEAWERTSGIKGIVILSGVIVYAALFVVALVLGVAFGTGEEASLVAPLLNQLVTMAITNPWLAGIAMIGLRQSVGLHVQFDQAFAYYGMVAPIVAIAILQTLGVGIGLVLLVLPGLYLMFAFSLAIPLKVEKDLPIGDCLVTSLKLVNQKFFTIAIMAVGCSFVVFVSFFTIIGWIWAAPWALMVYSITYRQLAGCELES